MPADVDASKAELAGEPSSAPFSGQLLNALILTPSGPELEILTNIAGSTL